MANICLTDNHQVRKNDQGLPELQPPRHKLNQICNTKLNQRWFLLEIWCCHTDIISSPNIFVCRKNFFVEMLPFCPVLQTSECEILEIASRCSGVNSVVSQSPWSECWSDPVRSGVALSEGHEPRADSASVTASIM